MLKKRPKIYSHPIVREAVKEALTERPLKWLPVKELIGYGELNYAVWMINEQADIEPAKMETNIEAVIRESRYRIRSSVCKIEEKAVSAQFNF